MPSRSVTPFQESVYRFLLTIPHGQVVTYRQIAILLDHPNAARAVGNALHRNPDGDTYPCYKVVDSNGQLASNFAFGGQDVQRQLLESEGIIVKNGRVDLSKYQFQPKTCYNRPEIAIQK